MVGGAVFLGVAGLNVIAELNDVRAFAALADRSTYAWLTLSLLCWGGLVFAARARRNGNPPPMYFRLVLLAGVASALLTIAIPVRVLGKSGETSPTVQLPKHIDLSGQVVRDQDLSDQDMRRARLTGTRFLHVDLSGANLAEADLRNAVMDDVDLGGAKLCGADIRGADLRRARNLSSVTDWSYAFYDDKTRLPRGRDFIEIPGPVKDTGRGLLYMCEVNETRHVRS